MNQGRAEPSLAFLIERSAELKRDVAALLEVGRVTPLPDLLGKRRVQPIAASVRMRRRSSSPRAPVDTEDHRTMTSRVIDCMLGRSAKGWPTGQRAISARVISRTEDSQARMRSPWNAGRISLR